MRYLIFSLFLFLSVSLKAQQIFSVPDLVKQAFDRQYPDANNLKWSGGLDNHTVRFTLNDKQMKAVYTKDGISKPFISIDTLERSLCICSNYYSEHIDGKA